MKHRIDLQLLEYNRQGLIPGPQEDEEAYIQRAEYCLNLKNELPKILNHGLPFDRTDLQSNQEIIQEGCERAKNLYDISPSWVPLFFSNYKLPFWQGGCAWIFQRTEASPTSAFFQLRQHFRKNVNYLGLYHRNELISHELSHVGRMMYEEPKFEEILAFDSSTSVFRRFFGPIVKSSYESSIFILILFFIVLFDFLSLIQGYTEWSVLSHFARLTLAAIVGYALVRLCIRQKQFRACKNKLCITLQNEDQARGVLYRLTDQEIIHLGRLTPDEIRSYAQAQNLKSIRWKIIHEAYFTNVIPSDHYDGVHFHNTPPSPSRNLKTVLKWMISRKPHPWPKKVQIKPAKPSFKLNEKELSVTFVNHSTFLIQWGHINILTDPIWSERCSPISFWGPKRVHDPGIQFEDLPPIHLVLVSHNHYDHMDLPTLKRLQQVHQPTIITGLGNQEYLNRKGLNKVIELDWWQETRLFDSLEIAFVPAQHFSMRNIFNKDKTLWGGFILKKDNEILYFAGDTGFTPQFENIKNRYGPPKISFLPIGAFEPRWFMKEAHMSPEEAISAHLILGSKQSLPIHFGTFPLSDESIHEPVEQLLKGLQKHHISEAEFPILQPGQSLGIK